MFVVATPRLNGVLLQWSLLFEPYAQNIVQYRAVSNLTLTASSNDNFTPYTTLAMSFSNGLSHEFTVPNSVLRPGTYYEFRLGFPFQTYTFYSNELVAKTYDANSPFVSNVGVVPKDVIASALWRQPEYSDGIVGYQVTLWYDEAGNGAVSTLQGKSTSALKQVLSSSLPLIQTSVTIGCTDLTSSLCLLPYTTYLLQIAVIRQAGTDSPKNTYFTTKPILLDNYNTSSLFLHGGKILMRFTVPIPVYSNASISATFLSPVMLSNEAGNLALTQLSKSTVNTLTNKTLEIVLDESEYAVLVNQLRQLSFTYSAITMKYGPSHVATDVFTYCLLQIFARP